MDTWWWGVWLGACVRTAVAGEETDDPIGARAREAVAARREAVGCVAEAQAIREAMGLVTEPLPAGHGCPAEVEGEREALDALLSSMDAGGRATGARALAGVLAQRLNGISEPAARVRAAARAIALAPGDMGVLAAAAGAYWSAGNPRAARALYLHLEREGERSPTRPEVGRALAELAWELGDTEEAQRRIDALTGDGALPAALIPLRERIAARARRARAEAILAHATPAEAREGLAMLLADAPGDVALLLARARAERADGDPGAARATVASARERAPHDPWPLLAEAELLVADGETEAARDLIGALAAPAEPAVVRERDRVLASALRVAGDAERAAGRQDAARARYEESLRVREDPWTRVGLAGLAMEQSRWADALAIYDALLAALPSGPAATPDALRARAVASRGRAGALEAGGDPVAALAVLDALAREQPTEEHAEARDALALRIAIARLDAMRRAGEVEEARGALQVLAVDSAESPDVHAALAAARLDAGDAAGAAQAAMLALRIDPAHGWAVDTAARAAEACACARELRAWVDAARIAGSSRAREVLPRLTVLALVESAAEERARSRRDLARGALRDAEALAGGDADAWRVIAQGWEDVGRHARARRAILRARSLAPVDPALLWAHVRLLRAQGHPAAADRVLREAAGTVPGVSAPATPAPATPAPAIPVEAPARPAAARSEVSPRVLARSGVVGLQRTFAVASPVSGGVAGRWGTLLLEGAPAQVGDGVHTERGIAPSVAWRAPAGDGTWGFALRAGVSPLGFAGGAYPVARASLRHAGAHLTWGLDTGRVPVHESLPAWAGGIDTATGARFGGVSLAYAGLSLAGAGARVDGGALARAGVASGLAMDPNPRGEAVAWIGGRMGDEPRALRLGLEAVAQANVRQADAFGLGAGAYYSPPLFGVGMLRVDGWATRGASSACLGLSGGAQHAEGRDSAWFLAGTRPVLGARGGVRWRGRRGGLRVSAAVLRVLGGDDALPWTQGTATVGAEWGGDDAVPDAASPGSTLGAAGAGLAPVEGPC